MVFTFQIAIAIYQLCIIIFWTFGHYYFDATALENGGLSVKIESKGMYGID
jgi:Trk-type K+ transport system membrane component